MFHISPEELINKTCYNPTEFDDKLVDRTLLERDGLLISIKSNVTSSSVFRDIIHVEENTAVAVPLDYQLVSHSIKILSLFLLNNE